MSALTGLLDGSFAVRSLIAPTTPRSTVDSRPRAEYRLPNGESIRVILDHGEVPPETLSFECRADAVGTRGVIVTAVLVRP